MERELDDKLSSFIQDCGSGSGSSRQGGSGFSLEIKKQKTSKIELFYLL